MFELLAGHLDESDDRLVQDILRYWGKGDIERLRLTAASGFLDDRQERDKRFGQMAPIVTEAALQGSRLARFVCDKALHEITVGIELLSSCFRNDAVAVAGIGSVINSPYMKSALEDKLRSGSHKHYSLADPTLSAVAGAVLMAFQQIGAPLGPETLRQIGRHPRSIETKRKGGRDTGDYSRLSGRTRCHSRHTAASPSRRLRSVTPPCDPHPDESPYPTRLL